MKERDYLRYIGLDGRTGLLLKWILKKSGFEGAAVDPAG
jgi:hypothetical protein